MIERIFRVVHGGGWYSNPGNLRAAYRNDNPPASRLNLIGFRLVVRIKDE